MKLALKTKPFRYLRPAFLEKRSIEETVDAIIPDSCPDAEEFLYCDGLLFLRGKELSDGVLNLSVATGGTGLVRVEGRDTPEVIDVYVPMNLRLENGNLKSSQQCRVKLSLKRMDGHLINSRKVTIRVSITVEVYCWETCADEIAWGCEDAGIETLQQTAPLNCLKCYGEKRFGLEDLIALSGDSPAKQLCAIQVRLRQTESRLTDSRAVFRGLAEVTVLYLTESGSLETQMQELHFAQYIDLDNCREEDQLKLSMCIGGCDADLAGDKISITMELVASAEVYGRVDIPYLSDLYSLRNEVTLEKSVHSYESLLDVQYFNPMEQCNLGGTFLFGRTGVEEIETKRNGQMVEVTAPVTITALVRTEDGDLSGKTAKVNLICQTQSEEHCRLVPELGNTELTPVGNAGSIRINGILSAMTTAETTFSSIEGADAADEPMATKGPGLVLRRIEPQQDMWEIAKQYHTTVAAISEANPSEGKHGKFLLIPDCKISSATL